MNGVPLTSEGKDEVIQLGFRYWKATDKGTPDCLAMRAAKTTYSRTKKNTGQFASRFKKVRASSGNLQWLVQTDRDAARAKPLVEGIFRKMYQDIDAVPDPLDKVLPICRAIRALHTAHIYVDANGRLNTMLLLNKLLGEVGFPPIHIKDTSVFGGSATAEQLARLVKEKLPKDEPAQII